MIENVAQAVSKSSSGLFKQKLEIQWGNEELELDLKQQIDKYADLNEKCDE